MGLFAFMKMERELEEALEREVDVVTEESINKHVRPYILKELRMIYGCGDKFPNE
jgi:predicted nucleotidyltransferase